MKIDVLGVSVNKPGNRRGRGEGCPGNQVAKRLAWRNIVFYSFENYIGRSPSGKSANETRGSMRGTPPIKHITMDRCIE